MRVTRLFGLPLPLSACLHSGEDDMIRLWKAFVVWSLYAAVIVSTPAYAEGEPQHFALPIAAITVPMGCEAASCPFDITIQDALSAYETVGKRWIESLRKTSEVDKAPLSPFEKFLVEPITERNICEEAKTIGFYYSWAPLSAFQNSEKIFSALVERLSKGISKNGYVLAELAVPNNVERHFALCQVTTVKGASGPPRDCTTVAVATKDQLLVRIGNGQQAFCYTSASFRNSGAIDIDFDVQSPVKPADLSKAIINLLQKNLELSATYRISSSKSNEFESAYFSGASSLRDSKILQAGWRESVDFSGYLERKDQRTYSFNGTVHAMICRQAVGDIVNYHGLDSVQQAAYAKFFNDNIEKVLKNNGGQCESKDAKSIICK